MSSTIQVHERLGGSPIQEVRHAEMAWVGAEYAFLLRRRVDRATLERAALLAVQWHVAPHAVLIALGWVREEDYVADLAAYLGLPTAPPQDIAFAGSATNGLPRQPLSAILRPRHRADRAMIVIEATAELPSAIAMRVRRPDERAVGHMRSSTAPFGFALCGRRAIEEAWQRRYRRRMLHRATSALRRASPADSAASQLMLRQHLRVTALVGLVIGTMIGAPDIAVYAWTMALTLPFLLVVLVRVLAVAHVVRAAAPAEDIGDPADRLSDAELPVYTVLVPLFREAHMLPHLLRVLQRLDYPAARLDVKIVLEEADPRTLAAARALELPGYVSLVVVPDGQPRTKPKALNYALQLARGDIVAIYDAEDAPEPDQLRIAVEAFRKGPPELACLQARLNIHNRRAGWLPRQFTLEYCALFDGLLPCLARLGLPLPLGGTSNHFKRSALAAVGAWDPHNVTEDADLGLRLHRKGWRTDVIASTTYEEAPERFRDWLPQRTRWLKGWMQTYLVHSRGLGARATKLSRLGDAPRLPDAVTWTTRLTSAIGVHILLGGLLLSILVHPWFYALAISEIVSGQFLGRPQSLMGESFWHLAVANLAVGFAAALALSAITAWKRGYRALSLHVLTLPIYWLLISAAGYRALWQLARDPFRWEKTAHKKHPAATS